MAGEVGGMKAGLMKNWNTLESYYTCTRDTYVTRKNNIPYYYGTTLPLCELPQIPSTTLLPWGVPLWEYLNPGRRYNTLVVSIESHDVGSMCLLE